jgi:predicted LPLAT superfamily acyltransferase
LWIDQAERGSRLLMQLMVYLALLLGRVAGRALLYPICAYFLVFSRRARLASTHYLSRVLERRPGVRDVFRHYLCFATTILDRAYLMAKRIEYFDCHVHGADALLAVAARREGCLLFGAHLGSFEMLRVLAATGCPVPVQILMYEQNGRCRSLRSEGRRRCCWLRRRSRAGKSSHYLPIASSPGTKFSYARFLAPKRRFLRVR